MKHIIDWDEEIAALQSKEHNNQRKLKINSNWRNACGYIIYLKTVNALERLSKAKQIVYKHIHIHV